MRKTASVHSDYLQELDYLSQLYGLYTAVTILSLEHAWNTPMLIYEKFVLEPLSKLVTRLSAPHFNISQH